MNLKDTGGTIISTLIIIAIYVALASQCLYQFSQLKRQIGDLSERMDRIETVIKEHFSVLADPAVR